MEYFNLKNLNPLIDLNGRKSKFINEFNHSGFSIEVIKELKKLVEELRLRNFDIPGFDIEFHLCIKTGEIRISSVNAFDLNFRFNGWEIKMKEMSVSLHEDGSGSLTTYVGDDWEADKKEFHYSYHSNRAYRKLKRIALNYERETFYYSHDLYKGGDTFKICTDSRDHEPTEKDPKTYHLPNVLRDIVIFIQNIIEHIQQYPITQTLNVFIEPEPEFLTNELFKNTALFACTDIYRDVEEVMENGICTNKRLLSLGHKSEKHPLKNIMNDGFTYMEIVHDVNGEVEIPKKPKNTTQYCVNSDSMKIYAITPKNYNNFFVIDASVFDKLKTEWFEANPGINYLTNDVCNEYLVKQAETIIPINEYKGNYEKPIVITNRTLWPTEIKHVASYQRKSYKK